MSRRNETLEERILRHLRDGSVERRDERDAAVVLADILHVGIRDVRGALYVLKQRGKIELEVDAAKPSLVRLVRTGYVPQTTQGRREQTWAKDDNGRQIPGTITKDHPRYGKHVGPVKVSRVGEAPTTAPAEFIPADPGLYPKDYDKSLRELAVAWETVGGLGETPTTDAAEAVRGRLRERKLRYQLQSVQRMFKVLGNAGAITRGKKGYQGVNLILGVSDAFPTYMVRVELLAEHLAEEVKRLTDQKKGVAHLVFRFFREVVSILGEDAQIPFKDLVKRIGINDYRYTRHVGPELRELGLVVEPAGPGHPHLRFQGPVEEHLEGPEEAEAEETIADESAESAPESEESPFDAVIAKIAALEAERDELRAELERVAAERDAAIVERDALREGAERLRKLLEQ